MEPSARKPLIAAVKMGYGHLRAAHALAEVAGTEVVSADEPPFARGGDAAQWQRSRRGYEALTRYAGWPIAGRAFRRLLDSVTHIPGIDAPGDHGAPNAGARMLARMIRGGLGASLIEELRRTGRPLISTFYAQAMAAAAAGIPDVTCVVTDVDVNRVWVPVDPKRAPLDYCVPAAITARRLVRYGVPRERIRVTGFPLPPSLLGGTDLVTAKVNMAARLGRLDPRGRFLKLHAAEVEEALGGAPPASREAPLLTIAVGGAGAQIAEAQRLLSAVSPLVYAGKLRVALIAGTRPHVAAALRNAADVRIHNAPPGAVQLVEGRDHPSYFRAFEEVLAGTDILWTKPSEMTFFAALGIPLLLAPPLGVHESRNRRYARRRGAALRMPADDEVADRIEDWIQDGLLAQTAWQGFTRMPRRGVYRILTRHLPA